MESTSSAPLLSVADIFGADIARKQDDMEEDDFMIEDEDDSPDKSS